MPSQKLKASTKSSFQFKQKNRGHSTLPKGFEQYRVVLARKILETVDETPHRRRGGRSAEEIIRLLNIRKSTPDDDECQQILDEELLRKYSK